MWLRSAAGSAGKEARTADHAEQRHQLLDHGLDVARPGRRAQQRLARGRRGLRQRRVAAARHDRREARDARRMADRDQLRDHATHRRADDVRACKVQRIHQAHRVVGHVVERVRGPHRQPQPLRCQRHHQGCAAASRHARRQAAVAIVEAHDAETLARQCCAERVGPGDRLHAQPHDQHDRRRLRVAERLVVDAHAVRVGRRHLRNLRRAPAPKSQYRVLRRGSR